MALTDAEKLSHAIDDAEKMRGRARRVIRQQVDLLEDGLHALRHERYEVADEFMERAIEALRAEVDRLAP